jgi:hypothetical protein
MDGGSGLDRSRRVRTRGRLNGLLSSGLAMIYFVWRGLRRRPWYWVGSVGVILFVPIVSRWIDENGTLLTYRYNVYRLALRCLPWQPYARETAIVLIDDDVYWNGEPAGRVPLNRRYLAKLVEAVANFNPAVIAIDVNLSSEDPSGVKLVPALGGKLKLPVAAAFADETAEFLQTIRAVSQKCKVVLGKTLGRDGAYFTQSDVYDGFPFVLPAHKLDRVSWGYVILPPDVRYVPRILRLTDGTPLDSFALAAVRARYAPALDGWNWEIPRLGVFVAPDKMVSLSAATLFDPKVDPKTLGDKLEHQIVLIGGDWCSRGQKQGARVDSYSTPFGALPGVFIHANYMETLLSHRIYIPLSAVWAVEARNRSHPVE